MPRRLRARRRRAPLVTLTSDVGAAYAAQMKAVLLARLSADRLVDLAHDLPAHGVREGAFLLRAMAGGFPPGTIHVAVVDPGVGGRRAPIVVACADGSLLIGPDNGLLMPLARQLGRPRVWRIDPERLGRGTRVGTTFDGRDVFAPAAALLARGRSPSALGSPWRPQELVLPEARRRREGAVGCVVHVDRFGNAITNVPTDWVPPGRDRLRLTSRRKSRSVPWVRSYDGRRPGELLALGSSFGLVELAVHLGSAARSVGLSVGRAVTLRWAPTRRTTGK